MCKFTSNSKAESSAIDLRAAPPALVSETPSDQEMSGTLLPSIEGSSSRRPIVEIPARNLRPRLASKDKDSPTKKPLAIRRRDSPDIFTILTDSEDDVSEFRSAKDDLEEEELSDKVSEFR